MEPTKTAFGIWSGGRFMRFGEDIGAERLSALAQKAYEAGIRTFMTADVYGEGEADRLLGDALSEFEPDSYCLVGAAGHDSYTGKRQAERGYPRFTDPQLRGPEEYRSYLRMAAEKQLERLGKDRFDLFLLHNPDATGYTHEAVWKGMAALKETGITRLLGIAPGPANGFTLDLIDAFERYGEVIDWAMIILNPLEPWPGGLSLPAAEKYDVKVITRVVDYGGLFHDGLKPGTQLPRGDHRSFRPPGWIEVAHEKLDRFREIAQSHDMTLLQLASQWALAQPAVESVVPTLIQESEEDSKPIEDQVKDLAGVSMFPPLSDEEVEEIGRLGDNRNCMALKGASTQYLGQPQGDQWPMTPELLEVGKRWKIDPDRDLFYAEDARDIREFGAPRHGVPQTSQRRLYLQLQAFGNCRETDELVEALKGSGLESVLYKDLNDPRGVAVLLITEDPGVLASEARGLLSGEPFGSLQHKPDLTMVGRTYSGGHEQVLEDWLLVKPRRNALNREWPWAVWYPLRRKPEFGRLPRADQGRILGEHARIGRTYGQAGYANDIRLACHGLDRDDNEFVIGLVGPELYPLSRIVQEMRKSEQTAKYIQSLGPFFVGQAVWQSPFK